MKQHQTTTRRPTGPAARRRAGVTLIELMVVMFILAVIVALVVGVSKWVQAEAARKETLASMGRIKDAISTYHDVYEFYPAELQLQSGTESVEYRKAKGLFHTLAAEATDPRVQKVLQEVPAANIWKGACPDFTCPSCHKTFDWIGFFHDEKSHPITYEKAGGLGGKPVLIAPGEDGKYGTSDDLRSDGRGQQ